MRLFVAAYPSDPALEHLAARVDELNIGRARSAGINTRLAGPALRHVTLAFLGDVADERRDAAVDAVAEAAANAAEVPSELRLAGGGTFGRGRFTILWVGLGGDVAGLGSLAGTVRTKLRKARLPFDRKPFRPHMTLARPGSGLSREEIHADATNLARYEGPPWTLTEIVLVESHLGPNPTHDAVHTAPLTPNP